MTEAAFLAAVSDFLEGIAPPQVLIGVAEPGDTDDLPCVVLSLEATERPGSGLGERTKLITDGVLEQQAQIDLAAPFLATDRTFSLVSEDRLTMTLPHGGLVRSDGTSGPLSGTDLVVEVDGSPLTLVADSPAADEFTADADSGRLTFGVALPAAGLLEATYFLGQWEQKVSRVAGVLRADVCAASAGEAAGISDSVVAALNGPEAADSVQRIVSIALIELSSVSTPEATVEPGAAARPATLRRRTARLRFLFEHVVDEPESSGGVITSVPVTSRIDAGSGPDGPEVMIVTG